MIALISALWILGGSATTHELAEWLEIERKSLRRLVGRAAEEGFVEPPGNTGRRGGLVKLTLACRHLDLHWQGIVLNWYCIVLN